jgi:oxygen-dependent protoporphyrinogen oxidase
LMMPDGHTPSFSHHQSHITPLTFSNLDVPDRPRESAPRIAIVGGGVTGLAAAHRLHRLLPSAELRLFEAGARLGGPLSTLRRDGFVLEQGADNFLTRDPAAADLCRELGLADQFIPTSAENRRALVVCRGRLVRVPEGFVLMQPHNLRGILRSPVLGLRGKLRLLAEPLIPRRASEATTDIDESVAAFATRRLGRETYERLVEPLLAGIYVADAHRLSLAATMPEFLAAEREHGSLWRGRRATRGDAASSGARYSQFLSLANGMESLIDALSAALPSGCIAHGVEVRELEAATPHGWLLHTHAGAPERFDGVILAIPAARAAALLHSVDRELSTLLAQITAASSAVITLVYRREQIARTLDGFGFVVPRVEGRPILAGSFPGVKFPDRGPRELVPIRVFMGGALYGDVLKRDDARLLEIAQRELADLIGAQGAPLESHITRWHESMPQYHVGHLALVEKIDARIASHPGLALAGASYRGVGIPQCIRSGQTSAECIAAQLAAFTRPR